MNESRQYLVFLLDERAIGLPLSQVLRVVRAVDCTPLPKAPASVLGVIDFQGLVAPVLSIRTRFGFVEKEISVNDQFIIAISGGRTVALMVDEVKQIIERDADQLVRVENFCPQAEAIEGVMHSDDGLTLIHDLDRFLSKAEDRALAEALAEALAGQG